MGYVKKRGWFLERKGAEKLLKDSRLISILIEVNKDLTLDQELIKIIQESGFQLIDVGKEVIYKGMRIGNMIFSRP